MANSKSVTDEDPHEMLKVPLDWPLYIVDIARKLLSEGPSTITYATTRKGLEEIRRKLDELAALGEDSWPDFSVICANKAEVKHLRWTLAYDTFTALDKAGKVRITDPVESGIGRYDSSWTEIPKGDCVCDDDYNVEGAFKKKEHSSWVYRSSLVEELEQEIILFQLFLSRHVSGYMTHVDWLCRAQAASGDTITFWNQLQASRGHLLVQMNACEACIKNNETFVALDVMVAEVCRVRTQLNLAVARGTAPILSSKILRIEEGLTESSQLSGSKATTRK